MFIDVYIYIYIPSILGGFDREKNKSKDVQITRQQEL